MYLHSCNTCVIVRFKEILCCGSYMRIYGCNTEYHIIFIPRTRQIKEMNGNVTIDFFSCALPALQGAQHVFLAFVISREVAGHADLL